MLPYKSSSHSAKCVHCAPQSGNPPPSAPQALSPPERSEHNPPPTGGHNLRPGGPSTFLVTTLLHNPRRQPRPPFLNLRRQPPPPPFEPSEPSEPSEPGPRSGPYRRIFPSTSCPSRGRALVNCQSRAFSWLQVLPHWAHQRGVPSGRAGRRMISVSQE